MSLKLEMVVADGPHSSFARDADPVDEQAGRYQDALAMDGVIRRDQKVAARHSWPERVFADADGRDRRGIGVPGQVDVANADPDDFAFPWAAWSGSHDAVTRPQIFHCTLAAAFRERGAASETSKSLTIA